MARKGVQPNQMDDLLTRGVEQIVVRESVAEKLSRGKPLRIKLGIDPTASKLHLGHAIILRKMKKMQDLGHTIIFLVGDFTARIGDPSEKEKARKPMTSKEIQANMQSYREQAGLILDMKKTEVRYNSEWFNHMDFAELFDILSLFSVQRMLERDMFQVRQKNNRPIWIHELLYPAMQGYDSVALRADIEFGGTDQTFNLLAARVLQPHYDQVPQDIMTFQLLEGLDGKEKMSMSIGNTINLTDLPDDMYGKTMSLPDTLITKYFLLCTDVPEAKIKQMELEMKKGANPKIYKEKLAQEIVALYHGKDKAEKVQEEFQRVFSKKGVPNVISEFEVPYGINATGAVAELFNESKAGARRLITQGSISVDGKPLKDPNASPPEGIYKKGRHFKKVRIKKP